jgi:hypothetical protein
VADASFPTYADERGDLIAVEFADVPFPVRRVFVVRGVEARLARGDHDVPCEEMVVLLQGSVVFTLGDPARSVEVRLDEPGQRLRLEPGQNVSYVLDGRGSEIIVLASEPYQARP